MLLLSKKHGQLKQAVTKMVQVVMGFLDATPNLDVKLSVIHTLRTVTEGKIFVEVERARVTRILSNIKKSQGDLNAAADTLCELQVETFGSMTRREKTEFILEQVALCIERGDWTQATILSRKINRRYFARKPKKSPEEIEKLKKQAEEREKTRGPDEPPMEVDDDVTDLKLRYYEQQIILANHDYKYLEVCKHFRDVLDTESVENNPEQLRAVCDCPSGFPPTPRVGHITNEDRSSRGLSIILFSPPTTTSSRTCCTASSRTRGYPWSLSRPVSSSSSPSMN